ncbi:expressed unknown protein [Seminavis robusta]|uniref:Uncharacterized protein n=1 Tax=Seminavis robusta TaxID=568900 RepID=A0A9N8H9W1_9STRA|nr:expressed unknown protein [Seminavis robusta]|eukprot:Sro295_g110370.1 n/a (142) ;mRNA; f:18559-18984
MRRLHKKPTNSDDSDSIVSHTSFGIYQDELNLAICHFTSVAESDFPPDESSGDDDDHPMTEEDWYRLCRDWRTAKQRRREEESGNVPGYRYRIRPEDVMTMESRMSTTYQSQFTHVDFLPLGAMIEEDDDTVAETDDEGDF